MATSDSNDNNGSNASDHAPTSGTSYSARSNTSGFPVRGGLLDAQELPFYSAGLKYNELGQRITERAPHEVNALNWRATEAGLQSLFPSSSQHQGMLEGISSVFLPEIKTREEVDVLNAQALSVFNSLLEYINQHPDHTMARNVRRADASIELSDVATRVIPAHPTLLPQDYPTDPVKSLRSYAEQISRLVSRKAPDVTSALVPLVWFPGASLAGYGTAAAQLNLRRFSLGAGEVLRPGFGYVTCPAWLDLASGVRGTKHHGSTVPGQPNIAHLIAQQLRRTELLERYIVTFTGGQNKSDYVTAWSSLIGTLMSEMGLNPFYRAHTTDFAHYPHATAARMPTYRAGRRPGVTMPYMPDRQPSSRRASAPRTADSVQSERIYESNYMDDEGGSDF